MNLLMEPWIPVRHRTGAKSWIRPCQLSDPEVVAFDADRADFNGALAQFAIGLLQTASPAQNVIQWRRLLESPPEADALQSWLAPHQAAFNLDGDGARFMQDLELRAGDGDPTAIAGLLIESPGENAVKNNSDHFVKRGRVQRLCPCCAALALFTLQTNAPAGGAGHRTGLRGGGPLTTLLVASPQEGAALPLWRTLWLNVMEPASVMGNGGDADLREPHFAFPWLASIERIQKSGGQTAPVQAHPLHVYWAMPRRIRLDFDAVTGGSCDLCGRGSDRLLRQYVTRNYGLNYKGAWRHPFSPYYEVKDDLLPVHPQPGGLGYRHWLGWVLGMAVDKRRVKPATVISQFDQRKLELKSGIALRLWAFGYDMDNMKARCWYESTMPLYDLGECDTADQVLLRQIVTQWIAGAELASKYLRDAVKDAWFGHEARGDFGHVDASFWSRTESDFYRLLREWMGSLRRGASPADQPLGQRWLALLQAHVRALFDHDWVGAGVIERQNPARIAEARRRLVWNLEGTKLREALGLPVEAEAKAKRGAKRSAKAAAGAA